MNVKKQMSESTATYSASRGAFDNHIGCVIMASGIGRRFGGNKLIEPLAGKPMIGHIIDKTEGIFSKRVVVTRSDEVAKYCKEKGVECILHKLPFRSDTVRLGTETMTDMKACMFCPGDQPLLKRETLEHMVERADSEPEYIWRLTKGEKHGAPVIFPQSMFAELQMLSGKEGGSQVIRNHMELLRYVEAVDEMELFDVDTREELLVAMSEFFDTFE